VQQTIEKTMIQSKPEEHTFVVFAIADYHLALPIEEVLQVVRYPSIQETELSKIGLIQIGHHLIQLIPLQSSSAQIAEQNAKQNAKQVEQLWKTQKFLIVIAGVEKKLYGIPVYEPPNLMKLPLSRVQCLPPGDRQIPLLDLVSHLIVRDQAESPAAIFLLNKDRF
jgi:purine-binding chemotaxis protein CheW